MVVLNLSLSQALSILGTSFLAATILPFSSEVMVMAVLNQGWSPWAVVALASVGNGLGGLSSYALGRLFSDWTKNRLEQSKSGKRALQWVQRYGGWCMAGSFLPIFGDPIMLAAGVFRINLWAVIALGLGTRTLRYVFLALPWLAWG